MLKLKLQLFGHLMRGTDSLEKTLMLDKIELLHGQLVSSMGAPIDHVEGLRQGESAQNLGQFPGIKKGLEWGGGEVNMESWIPYLLGGLG